MSIQTYTIGRIISGGYHGMSYPRALLCDGKQVAVVDSCEGPVMVGDMTADEAKRRYPSAFSVYCRETGRVIA